MYKIDKGLSIPEKIEGRGRKMLYPWREMEIGDSILLPEEEATKARQSASHYKTRCDEGFNYVSRVVDGGVRFWKTGND